MAHQRITIIEDDEILAKVLSEELEERGFKILRAKDGVEGLELVTDKKPDLVLLDLLIPRKNGFSVLEELKANPSTAAIPVIILSMLGHDDEIKRGLKLGANDYIVKSQHAAGEIVDKIEEFFGQEQHPEAKKPTLPARAKR